MVNSTQGAQSQISKASFILSVFLVVGSVVVPFTEHQIILNASIQILCPLFLKQLTCDYQIRAVYDSCHFHIYAVQHATQTQDPC